MLQRTYPRKKDLRRLQRPKWEKVKEEEAPYIRNCWKDETAVGIWRYMGVPIAFLIVVTAHNSTWGEVMHITIKKVNQFKTNVKEPHHFYSEEPTFAEKIQIRQVVKQVNRIALEVFPKQRELVDAADLYHEWLLPEEFSFPFPLVVQDEIQLDEMSEDIAFGKKTIQTEWGPVSYYILEGKDKEELVWRKKQDFKNRVCGYERIAIEVIPPKATCSAYRGKSALICLPEQISLPFGLVHK